MAVLLTVPSLMIFLTAGLRPWVSRWVNVGLGVFYTVIEGLTLVGSPLFYRVVVVGEMGVTVLIVFYALPWPRRVVWA